MEKTRVSIIVFLIMISIMTQRYSVVHLHNVLSMAKKNNIKHNPLFVSFPPNTISHCLSDSTALLHGVHTDWRVPELLRYIPVRKNTKRTMPS